jgi:hypothetical protein
MRVMQLPSAGISVGINVGISVAMGVPFLSLPWVRSHAPKSSPFVPRLTMTDRPSAKKWTNMSMDPPPEHYAWACQVCSSTNAAGALQCSRCGCPDRVDGRELAERQRQFA